jgi:BMFP domain-containing protein YqiC
MKIEQFLHDLAKRLSEVLPENVQKLQKDAQKNFHSVLQGAFNKLDLVTREEFDAQTKVLARSRKKIDELAARIKELETLIEKKRK